MTVFETLRVAAVQATPVILDADTTIDKAVALIGEAADRGATLVVFPECFVSIYPSGTWAAAAATWAHGCDELWERMWASSVDVGGPLVDRLALACAEHGVHVAIGVNEREDERPGSLYNSLLIIGADGLLHRHRKLMPTMHERVFHGVGAGDDLGVVELPGARGSAGSSAGRTACRSPGGGCTKAARRSGWRRPRTTVTGGSPRCVTSRSRPGRSS